MGRFVLDSLLPEPAQHDTYSMLAGVHCMILGAWGYKQIARQWRIHQKPKRISSSSSAKTRLNSRGTLFGIIAAIRYGLLAVNAGLVLPSLVGSAFHMYVLVPFQSSGTEAPRLSISMDWAYGLVLCSLAGSISKLVRPNRLSALLNSVSDPSQHIDLHQLIIITQVQVEGIFKSASMLNGKIAWINFRLILAIILPGLINWLYLIARRAMWRVMYQTQPPPASNPMYTFRAALFSVSCTTAAVWLSGPVRKLGSKWVAKIWEKEYLVQRKLRNIDDPPLENDGPQSSS